MRSTTLYTLFLFFLYDPDFSISVHQILQKFIISRTIWNCLRKITSIPLLLKNPSNTMIELSNTVISHRTLQILQNVTTNNRQQKNTSDAIRYCIQKFVISRKILQYLTTRIYKKLRRYCFRSYDKVRRSYKML